MAGIKRTPLTERFWSKVNRTDGCWLWTRQLNNQGYGCFTMRNPIGPRKYRPMYAHRIAWEWTHGPIPDGLNVLHRCDTPSCVNPAHLFLGTKGDNAKDRDEKGRVCRGESHADAKLTKEQVIAIRLDNRLLRLIAAEYGIGESAVSKIKLRVAWKHVD